VTRSFAARALVVVAAMVTASLWLPEPVRATGSESQPGAAFEVSFPSSIRNSPVTGRVLIVVTKENSTEPRFQSGDVDNRVVPIFGVDVAQWKPGVPAIVDGNSSGFPVKLDELPSGDYYVQAILNVYTECHRADGHAVWVHLDQWEGQQFATSPGNLISAATRVHLDRQAHIRLTLNKILPAIDAPPDTEWVKHIKFKSTMLSTFWGCPIFIGATVLLPKGYKSHPNVSYPVMYLQNHFSLEAPFGFDSAAEVTHPTYDEDLAAHRGLNVMEPPRPLRLASEALLMPETAREFYQAWTSDDFPRMIAVTFQHPTPYFDDSYAVNSANNGPYGDAIMQELIPQVESRFRIIDKSYARALTGGSTGGWETLALQTYHPGFFGGAWVFYPDPVDFRRLGIVNIYGDKNFFETSEEWVHAPRFMQRSSDGQPRITNRQLTDFESVLGTKLRSAGQFAIWQATYGPVDDDGYPKPLWNATTGEIDPSVANYMRDHGYDLRSYLESNWKTIGPILAGKIHVFCGDMDNYYLNLGVYLLQDFLVNAENPAYGGSFQFGRPMKGHGWQPTTNFELIKNIAEQISRNTPGSEQAGSWHYH
jgi:Putative esterase